MDEQSVKLRKIGAQTIKQNWLNRFALFENTEPQLNGRIIERNVSAMTSSEHTLRNCLLGPLAATHANFICGSAEFWNSAKCERKGIRVRREAGTRSTVVR